MKPTLTPAEREALLEASRFASRIPLRERPALRSALEKLGVTVAPDAFPLAAWAAASALLITIAERRAAGRPGARPRKR